MTALRWSITATHFVNCNCDFGCPCQFNALPTDRTCRALAAWDIHEGYFGNVQLDGLRAINTYSWPGAVHQGNGSLQTIVDERATGLVNEEAGRPVTRPAHTRLFQYIDKEGTRLTELSRRVGFRVIPGLGERVIYRELFPKGLTMLDLKQLGDVGLGHIAARQELREMISGLGLPSLDAAQGKAA